MKEKIGTFMIAAILSCSCVYLARASNRAFIPPPTGHPAEIVIYGPYYYDGPLDVLHLSELPKAPQSAKPYKSLSDEEILNWANTTK